MTEPRSSIGILTQGERSALGWLARALPAAAAPHPTWLEVGGAALMVAGFIGCSFSNWMLAVVFVGLFVNWLGDAALLENSVSHDSQRGFFVDHSTDLIAQTLVVMGLGFSPYFTVCSALLVLSLLLLMSSFSYIRFMVMGTGAAARGRHVSEVCLGAALWALLGAAVGPSLTQTRLFDRVALDVCVGVLWLAGFAAFVVKVRRDLAHIEDGPPSSRKP